MKRILLVTLILIFNLLNAFPQDRIITLKNDTIDCKITRISRNKISFELDTHGIKSNAELPVNGVRLYIVSPQATSDKTKITLQDPFKRLCLSVNAGPGYLLGSTEEAVKMMKSQGLASSQADAYYKNFKTGFLANAELGFYFNPFYGAAIKYKFFNTSAHLEGFFDPQDGVNLIFSTYEEHVYVNYIGTSALFQQFIGSGKSLKIKSSIGAGLTTYRNEAEYLNDFFLLQGKNAGLETGIGLEYFLTDRISASTDLSMFYSSIRKVKVSDGSNSATVELEKENFENLSRIELSIGLRIYLWNR
jgi:hypothetical protein